jgi:hypothetical protein
MDLRMIRMKLKKRKQNYRNIGKKYQKEKIYLKEEVYY